tara:strand:+ start:737 stop:1384 length:648 start_codon:yes stop_codon:yes gene_type:complete
LQKHANSALAHHFEDLDQQHQAHSLGMWAFLVQEIMFFGALFAGYTIYRMMYPDAWDVGSHHLNVQIGAANTAVLLASSLTMALAVRCAQLGQQKWLVTNLVLTLVLGAVFLGVKVVEYADKYHHHLVPGTGFQTPAGEPEKLEMFFNFYFLMTGCHAFHMIIGGGVLVYLIWKAMRGSYLKDHFAPIEMMGLYWHFVDLVWIFLFPLLYLLGRH